MKKSSANRMTTLWSLLFCAIAASTACAQVPIMEQTEVIKEGVCIIRLYPDSVTIDTLSIEEFINQQPDAPEQRNKNLRQLNEMMKEPE